MTHRIDQEAHDRIVEQVAAYAQRKGLLNVRADIQGYTKPDSFQWPNKEVEHTPDVTALDNRTVNIYEVETPDSIFDPHTADQWSCFATFDEHSPDFSFYVVVPQGYKSDAEVRLVELNIAATVLSIEELNKME